MAITYFAKEGLQGLVIACSCGTSLAWHVGLYPGPLQGAAGPHQAQVCQPFLHTASVMQALNWESVACAFEPMFCFYTYASLSKHVKHALFICFHMLFGHYSRSKVCSSTICSPILPSLHPFVDPPISIDMSAGQDQLID